MNWKKAHIISKWIFAIYFAPLQYVFVGAILMAILATLLSLVPNLGPTIDHSKYGTILITTLAILGFFLYLFFVIKRLKETTYNDFIFHFRKVKLGIILNYLGHLGLFSIYALYLYCLTLPSSSCSGFFIIPSLIWMAVFYLMGTYFTSIDRNIYTIKQHLDLQLQDNTITKEEYEKSLNSLYHGQNITVAETENTTKNR